SLN
ncbi:type III secretion apparatus H+-transporting two-sector ATPase, partial [Vibrio parahaemolyticus EKP-028]